MQMQDFLSAKGEVFIEIKGPDQIIKEKIHIPNLVVQAGRDFIAERLISNTDNFMTHMAVGTDGTTQALSDTALGSEEARQAFDSATRNANVTTFVTTYAPGTATAGIQEAGIFNAASGGTMLCRTAFLVVNKAAADTMVVTWVITIS